MTPPQAPPLPPRLLEELPEADRNRMLDRLEQWLGAVLMAQSALTTYYEDASMKVEGVELKERLGDLHAKALEHERRVEDLYRAIGREPWDVREAIGGVMAKAREFMADVEGFAAGASGGYADLQEVAVANFRSTGAFATAMRLGIHLGISEVADIALRVVNEKATHQMILQEILLDLAPEGILHRSPV